MKDVFFVTSWGYAADHLFGWLPKAINSHPELFALLSHEGSRPKYLKERTRGQRPDIKSYAYFLSDMSKTYQSIGDCYSYRAAAVDSLINQPGLSGLRAINLIRNPITWINFYCLWRSRNMRTSDGSTEAIEWEWKINRGPYFESLGVEMPEQTDISRWAFLQGLTHLNNLPDELSLKNIKTITIESLAEDKAKFAQTVNYLTHDAINFSHAQLATAYSLLPGLYRGELEVNSAQPDILASWDSWHYKSFERIVNKDTIDSFEKLGYKLNELKKNNSSNVYISCDRKRNMPPAKVFVTTPRKAGTHAIRSLITSLSGMKYYEPNIQGDKNYGDWSIVDWPLNSYFSWHSLITPEIASLLQSGGIKTICITRNIYDIIFSFYNHLVFDVDASIGKSIDANAFIRQASFEHGITMIINGYFDTETGERFDGIYSELLRMRSYFEYSITSENILIIDFEHLFDSGQELILDRVARYLEIEEPLSRNFKLNKRKPVKIKSLFKRIFQNSTLASSSEQGTHYSNPLREKLVNHLKPYHISMITNLYLKAFEGFSQEHYISTLQKFGLDDISRNKYL